MDLLTSLSEWGYIGLFITGFLAGSVAPFSSEAVMALLIAAGYPLWSCVLVATAGNWLGGLSCYYIGYLGKIDWIERYLKIDHLKLQRMQQRLQSWWGMFMAFFVFVPVVGDLIVVALGLMRVNVWGVSLFMGLGKLARYILTAYGVEQLLGWL